MLPARINDFLGPTSAVCLEPLITIRQNKSFHLLNPSSRLHVGPTRGSNLQCEQHREAENGRDPWFTGRAHALG